ncbi:MAG: hypothetical protein RLZZ618_633 [Pseudomonadota bacterium]|jgi:hypothetical protein
MSIAVRCLTFLSTHLRRRERGPSLDTLKCLCLELIDDVCPKRRSLLSRSILGARHNADVWNLRSALFGGVSMSFGETVARERMARLDDLLH